MHNFKESKLKVTGLLLFLLGAFIIFYSGIKITGFAVSQENSGGIFFIGIAFVLGGILLINLGGKGQLEIKLYQEADKNGRGHTLMTDPENLFGNGAVTLDRFRKEIHDLKKDPELFKIVRKTYLATLIRKYEEGGAEAQLARKYLIEMDFEPEEEEEKGYAIPLEERMKIKNAFNDIGGKITPAQMRILKKYDLVYTIGKTHAKISPEQGGRSIAMGKSPSDVNAGKNTSSLLLKLCDEQYRKKLK
jgi:hypothetical protein